MAKLKTLANCKPSEFLKQTNKIRKAAAKWLTATDILAIRKNLPRLIEITEDMTDEEREEATMQNRTALRAQARENAVAILDAVMDEHPDETLELMALLCFVDPKDVDKHTVSEYLEAFTELIGSEAVIGFFTSLARLGQMNMRTL